MPAHKVAVVIPIYQSSISQTEYYSINRTFELLGDRDIYFAGPESLGDWLYHERQKHESSGGIRLFNCHYFASIEGYNKLMTSREFYLSFSEHDYLLIAQPDSLVISDLLDNWCDQGYSYIGAPWFEGYTQPVMPPRFAGVGNGGFSLRKPSDFLRVLSGLKYIPNTLEHREGFLPSLKCNFYNRLIYAYNRQPLAPRVYEDIFWGTLVSERFDFFHVPTPEEASLFAFEVLPDYLYQLTGNTLPFGCHAWERYNREFWVEKLSM